MVKLFDLSKRGHSSPTSTSLKTNINKEKADLSNSKTDFKTKNYNVKHDRRLLPLSSSESREPVSLSRLPKIEEIERHHKHSFPNSLFTHSEEQTCLLLTSNYVNCINHMELEFLPSLRKDVDGISRKTSTNLVHEYHEEQEQNSKINLTKCKNNEFREACVHHYYEESMSKEPNVKKNVSKVDANTNINTQIASQNFRRTPSPQEEQRCNKKKQYLDEDEIHNETHKVNNNERTVSSLQMRNEEMYDGVISAKCEPTLSSAFAQTSENFYHHRVLHEYLAMASPLMTNNKQSQAPFFSEYIELFSNDITNSGNNYNSYGNYANVEYNKKEISLPAASISTHEPTTENLELQREKDNINSCNNYKCDERSKNNENRSKSNKKTRNDKKMLNKWKENKSEVLVSSQLCVCELPEMQNSSSQATWQSPFLTSSSLPPSHSSSFTPTPPSTTFTAIRASPFARSTSCEDSFLRSISGHEMSMECNLKKSSVNINLQTQKCKYETPESRTIMEANESCKSKHYENINISSNSSIHAVHQVNSCKAMFNAINREYSVLYELMSELQNALVVLNTQYVRIDNETGEIVANNIHEIKVEKLDTAQVDNENKNSRNVKGIAELAKETYVYVAKGNDDEVLPLLWCDLSVENVTTNHSSTYTVCQGDNITATVGTTATTVTNGKSKSIGSEENANNLLHVMRLSHQGYVNLLSAIWLVRLILPDFPCNSHLLERSPLMEKQQQEQQQQRWLKLMTNVLEWVCINDEEELLSYWHSATRWLTMLEQFFMKCVAFSLEAKDNVEHQNKSSTNVITDLENFADYAYSAMNKEREVKEQWEYKIYKEQKLNVSAYVGLVQSFTDVNNLECLPESTWSHSPPRCNFIDHVTYFLRPCLPLYQFRKEESDQERLNRVNNNTCIATTQTETIPVQKEYVYRLFMNASQFSSIPDNVFSTANSDSSVSTEEHCENEHMYELQQSLHNINKKYEEQVLSLSSYMHTSAQAAHLHTRLTYSFVYKAQCIDRNDECTAVDKRGGVATGLYSMLIQQLPEASFVDCMLMLAKLHYAFWEVKHNDCQNQRMLALCKQINSSAANLLLSKDAAVRLLNLFEEVEHDIFVNIGNSINNKPEQKDASGDVDLSSWYNNFFSSLTEISSESNSTCGNNHSTCEYHNEINNPKESSFTMLWHVVKRINAFFVHKTETQLAQLMQALLEDMIAQEKLQFKPYSVNEQSANRSIMENNQNTETEGNTSKEEKDNMQMTSNLQNIACFLGKLLYAEKEFITLIDEFVSDYDKFVSAEDFCHDKEMWRQKLHFLHELLSLPVDVDALFMYAKPEPFSSTKEENVTRKSKLYGSQSNFVEAVRLQYYTHLIEYTLELQNTIVNIPLTQGAKCNIAAAPAAAAAITYNASSEGSIVNNDSNEQTFLVPVQTLDSYNIIKELSTFAETTRFCSSAESNVSRQDTSPMHTTPHKRKPLWLRRSISPSTPININNAVTTTTTTTTTNASSLSFSSFSSSCSSPSLLAKLSSPLISSSPLMLLLLHQERNRNRSKKIKRRLMKKRRKSNICNDGKCELFLPASATMTLSSSSSIASSEPSSSPLSTGLSSSHNIKTHYTHVSTRSDAARLTCGKNTPNTFAELECVSNTSNVPQSSLESPLTLSLSSPSHVSTSSMEINSSEESREGIRSQLYRLDTPTPHHPERQKYIMCDEVCKLEDSYGDRQNKTITYEQQLLEYEEVGVHDEVKRQGSISVPSLSTYSINSSSTPTLSIVTTSVEPNSPVSPEFSEKLSYDNNISSNHKNDKYDKCAPQSAETSREESKKSNSTIDMYHDISIVNSPTSIHETTLPFTHAMQIMSSLKTTSARNNGSTPVNISSSTNSFNNNVDNDANDDRKVTKVGGSASPSLFVPLRIVFNTLVNFCTHKSSHEVAEYLHHLLLLYTEQRNIENEESGSQTNKNNNDNDNSDSASFHDKVSEHNKEMSLTILQQCTDEELFGPLSQKQYYVNTHTAPDAHNYLCDELVVNVQDLASLCTLVLFY